MNRRDFRSWRALRDLCADGLYQLSCWIKAANIPDQPIVLPVRMQFCKRGASGVDCDLAAMTFYGGDRAEINDGDTRNGGPAALILRRLPDEAGLPAFRVTLRVDEWVAGGAP